MLDQIWRGGFYILGIATMNGLVAHIANKAALKLSQAAAHLIPSLLHFEMVPRLHVWPKKFGKSPSTDTNFDLYMFPENESAREGFENLLNQMTCEDLVLKAEFHNLLFWVFTSHQVPFKYWNINKRKYMWAVFGKKNILPLCQWRNDQFFRKPQV
ncbi:RING/FYVE/PHD zinc finger superfamily protein [Quillaja saponaria]|uniref:RING/FYVE/PHD zinc finger superfamily protein n=1 Tax=Quillaja saponaria TaxID=32244 RepID=A0AAD7VFV6_QUISA|nr:RING/FYVE/PHD zinc finger superfamily protein [Quillaja saponaria]